MVADTRKQLQADENAKGRFDIWLTRSLNGELSRSRIKALIENGQVRVNDTTMRTPRQPVEPGDVVTIDIPPAADPTPKPQNIPLTVLHEDADLIVIDKPAGLIVHPGAGAHEGTLVNALLAHCGDSLSGIGGVKRPGIVHRLDRDTTGVMVIAKNDAAHRDLSDQFADHGRTGPLERLYMAMVWGSPDRPKGRIDASLGRSSTNRTRQAVVAAGRSDAREAVTHYRRLEQFPQPAKGASAAIASLVECRLETGRTHQIRVHMAHINHPLIGDRDYGAGFATKTELLPPATADIVRNFNRQALHAFHLAFRHPASGERVEFQTPPPPDMGALIDALRQLGKTD